MGKTNKDSKKPSILDLARTPLLRQLQDAAQDGDYRCALEACRALIELDEVSDMLNGRVRLEEVCSKKDENSAFGVSCKCTRCRTARRELASNRPLATSRHCDWCSGMTHVYRSYHCEDCELYIHQCGPCAKRQPLARCPIDPTHHLTRIGRGESGK